MEIIEIWPVSSAGSAIARFNIQMPGGIRLFNLKLARRPDGAFRVFAPSAFGSSAATFTPETATSIAQAAVAALGEIRRDDSFKS